jgi:hypothetical protein
MKVAPAQALFCFATLLFGTAGCSSPPRTDGRPSVAIAVMMAGGGAPSPVQVAQIQKAMQPEIAQAGYVLAPNPRAADYLVQVRFTPDAISPSGGRITLVTIESNRRGESRTDAAQAGRDAGRREADLARRNLTSEPK